ncbi:hypothetical protein DL1_11835 [Thioclava dalianensis]|uniref:Uncharacterized protein n=1 Tax=Thioclava dalianensis TaxID=1185766 RepID=A0A074T9R2_9RHOB|nr:hypothetical protein [Thioclava dalianensis]KEP68429.1 hypothetical protein DL1_11835 [Thioclava dalianensis]SFN62058.1 hypothetical protein SAMN05216224_10831 [Thioclava dalianensis]
MSDLEALQKRIDELEADVASLRSYARNSDKTLARLTLHILQHGTNSRYRPPGQSLNQHDMNESDLAFYGNLLR